jgi:hypothetical protein
VEKLALRNRGWENIVGTPRIFEKNPFDRLWFFLTAQGLGLELNDAKANVGC